MLRFFRSSSIVVVAVIILIGVLTWLHVLTGAETALSEKYGTFMFQSLIGLFANIPRLYVWLGLTLSLLSAIIMILVNTRVNLIDRVPYFPALCYILLIGGMPDIHFFNPVIIATMLLSAGFVLLVGSFESEQLSYKYFTVPAIISFATFFYQYMYFYMIAVWIVIALWRPGYWREWIFSILGFALPLFFLFSWSFLVEDDATRISVFFNEIFNMQRVATSLSLSVKLFLVFISTMVIITFVFSWRYISSKKTTIRTGYYLLMLIILITVVIVFIVPDTLPQAWYLLAFPLSFLISNYFANVRSTRIGDIVLAIFFVGVIVAHFVRP